MDFPNFPYKGLDDVSFLKPRQVQEYMELFTKHFKLNNYIRVRITVHIHWDINLWVGQCNHRLNRYIL